MPDIQSAQNDFIQKISDIVEANISNEHFGVSELAAEISMSRSNLLRKVKKDTKLSVSQFIRQIRLKNAMKLLRETSSNVSEVSFKVGFGSTSYFIKCFHDYYGFSPGEVGKRETNDNDFKEPKQKDTTFKTAFIRTFVIVFITVVLIFIINPFKSNQVQFEKSIAVLPFINDSNDSTNVHIINGLMESVLNNLQKIKGLRVISRTSVEKYRNTEKLIPEIGKELNVNYFVEGSGQKIGDEIFLHIQLIEAPTDKHLLSERYKREVKNIFELQTEIAKNIADKIQVIITPEEEERINKLLTRDYEAYNYFLKGLDLFYTLTPENLRLAINYYEKAIELDDEFARAYAGIAIAYYFLDFNKAEKQYLSLINNYADKAFLLDSQLEQSLIAKSLYYIQIGEYGMAVTYLEKALVYNPNSALVLNILSDFYTNYIPDTKKYLEYALKGIRIDIAANDSISTSYIYLHLSNALIQAGFINEAEVFINKSIEYNTENLFSEYVKAYILYARNRDLAETKDLLLLSLNKDQNRYDILIEIVKICYYMRDYQEAYKYYKKIEDIEEAQNLDIFIGENAKVGLILDKIGLKTQSDKYFQDYKEYFENDKSIYKHLSLSVYYSYKGNTNKAIEHLRLFSQENNYHYWILLFLTIDPLFDNIIDLPEFRIIINDIENKFWKMHEEIKISLEEKELLGF